MTFKCASRDKATRDAYKVSNVCRDDGGITTQCLFKSADVFPCWDAPPFECSAGGPMATAVQAAAYSRYTRAAVS